MAERPHPEVRDLLAEVDRTPVAPTHALSVASARDRLRQFTADEPVEPVANTEEYAIPGPAEDIPVRVYEPDAEPPYPVTVYFHGGGWTVGGLDTHDNVCAALTNRADCLTVSVDYRLAPEHPFPAAVEDAYAAVEWVGAHADRLCADADRLAVAGDSAGGNLAAATTLMARDHDGPDVAYQALVYPVVASPAIHDFDSLTENAEGYFLETASMEWYYDRYAGSRAHARNDYFAPLLTEFTDDLPPATVLTAGFDPLRDEGIEYARRLESAGVPVEHRHYEEMIHAFVSVPSRISRGAEALDALGSDLAAAFEA